MTFLLVVLDGCAEEPLMALGNRTPLEVAKMPNLDCITKMSRVFRSNFVPESLPCGSEVANMAILGYDPIKFYTGRGALEARSLGLKIKEGKAAFRLNLVYASDEIMLDHSAGHIKTEIARKIIFETREKILDGINAEIYPGVSYRHILVGDESWLNAKLTPPHDILGLKYTDYLPDYEELRALVDNSIKIFRDYVSKDPDLKISMVWPWGGGRVINLPKLKDKFGFKGAVISAVDLINGLGILCGLEPVKVDNITGFIDSNFIGKAYAAVEASKDHNFVMVHIEAPDECAHRGDPFLKISALEKIDSEFFSIILNNLSLFERILVVSDHLTSCEIKTHKHGDVPVLFYDTSYKGKLENARFTESSSSGSKFIVGHKLLEELIS
ncbi:phosphonopyruvate decarboxylase-related protein [Thermodesulfobium narugense DSM 14796]|uniref:Phosphonopyruvate decarboxylase-related protein n=1 Tax=Thermodesulfobium narugense DSM 14796 TaxID=747365 RepID=M1E4Z6_9BACT|nr:2,3-bisphosphoglycerate-independent phosphoglycerate mutase [Thermodesulfobium narugense]AEE13876.1 phosphonopyruvate decarboxylase-related protein [Thermodesulfobium narugense DSM 14796]